MKRRLQELHPYYFRPSLRTAARAVEGAAAGHEDHPDVIKAEFAAPGEREKEPVKLEENPFK